MPKNSFVHKWLQKLDNTGKVCSRWLKKGKTISSFQCIVCRTDDLSCANGGWTDIKRHFDRPKRSQCMKNVFGSVSLIASNGQSPPLSNNKDANIVCTATLFTNGNTTRIPFVTIQSDKRALTHEESKYLTLLFTVFMAVSFHQLVCKKIKKLSQRENKSG
jgi:hypothetical protein